MPPLSPVAKQLIILAVGSFVVQMLLEIWLGVPVSQLLVLRGGPPTIADLWRLMTYALVWPPGQGAVFSLAFVCLGFWWMVGPIEMRYGARRAWAFVAFAVLAAAIPARVVGFFLPGTILYGAGAVFIGAIAVFAFSLRDQVVQLFGVISLRAMHVLYIALAFSVLSFIASANLGSLVADLGAVGAGWWFVQQGGDILGRTPSVGRRQKKKRPGRRGNLRVVDDDEDERPRWLN